MQFFLISCTISHLRSDKKELRCIVEIETVNLHGNRHQLLEGQNFVRLYFTSLALACTKLILIKASSALHFTIGGGGGGVYI